MLVLIVVTLSLLLQTLSASPPPHTLTTGPPPLNTRRPGLTIDTLTTERVDGSYFDPSTELGVVFNSTKDLLSIISLDGTILVEAGGKLNDDVRIVSIGENKFLQHSKHGDLAVSKSHENLLESTSIHQLVHVLQEVPEESHTQQLHKSVDNLLTRPEIKLLKDAATSLGALGVTGVTYPSILPFFMTSLRLTSTPNVGPAISYTDHLRLRRSANTCLNSCPPCKERQCLGLCGPGCTCWKWACGDCCYHKGCLYHDKCCRERPNSTACLLPLDFSCEEEYKCTKD